MKRWGGCEWKKGERVREWGVKGGWEIYQWQTCFLTWRSCEPERIRNAGGFN
ncbi:non-oxidative hydroxyarylic acid decarboxylases subunit D, partial [Bacillus velezensis]|uniref:non-oxidative hydroxyarylic acid decarboxylases subunit D n=1 Tax=Bacillus velezensis TaxID=492670 RepID=UPI0021B5CA32